MRQLVGSLLMLILMMHALLLMLPVVLVRATAAVGAFWAENFAHIIFAITRRESHTVGLCRVGSIIISSRGVIWGHHDFLLLRSLDQTVNTVRVHLVGISDVIIGHRRGGGDLAGVAWSEIRIIIIITRTHLP